MAAAGPDTAASPAVDTLVQERPAQDRWLVEYRLSTPAMGLRFVRNRSRYRAARWRIVAPAGVAWTERDGHEELVTTDGAPIERVQIEFDTLLENQRKDYELNKAFSDGSRLLYTGQLVAYPLMCRGSEPCPVTDTSPAADPASRWQFRTAGGRWIRLLDRAGVGTLSWTPSSEHALDGTYVYFGNIQAVEEGGITAIIDPALPSWMRVMTQRLVPRLFGHYAAKMGHDLTTRPLFLLSFGGFAQGGHSMGGGVLRGLVQLSVEGEDFREPSPDATLYWHRFLAHEIFHLWNGDRFVTDIGPHEEWLSEGGADYLAFSALRDLGLMDQGAFQQQVIQAANLCLTQLDGRPLLAPPPRFLSFYPCGMTLMAWADGAARRAGFDIYEVLRRVFAVAAAREMPRYSTYDFLEQMERVTGDPLAVGPLELVLRTGIQEAADTFFAQQLGAAGIPATLVEPREAILTPHQVRMLLANQLVRCDCTSEIPARVRQDAIEIGAHASCSVFRNGARITHVGDHAVADAPAEAYQALREHARDDRSAVLRDGDSTLALRCRAGGVEGSFVKLLR